jgi:magnesium transporter
MPDIAEATETAAAEPVASIMSRSVAVVPGSLTCAEAVASLAAQTGAQTIYQACVTAPDGRLAGLVSLRRCLVQPGTTPVADILARPAITLRESDDAGISAHRLLEAGLESAPVLDAGGRVTGLVTAETAQRFLLEELEETTDSFAGLVGEPADDYFDHSVWSDYWRRAPWVLGLAVAGLAAGYVVHIYEDALSALVILALYMPMVADTGGNVGTQSASLITRAMSVGDVGLRDTARIMWREARVALLMAATLFAFAFLKVYLISNSADVPGGLTLEAIGFAIAVALAMQVITATLIGAALPIAAVLVRQDPAVVSGPALTTIVDLTGLILYFTVTTWLLGFPFAS